MGAAVIVTQGSAGMILPSEKSSIPLLVAPLGARERGN
jgi:hypothetical protein